jgi:hypothetical protein
MKPLFTLLLGLLLACMLPAQNVTISGTVLNPDNDPLENIMIKINDGPSSYVTYTDPNGDYSIDVPENGSYTIRPCAFSNVLNGLSTFDLVLLTRHYSGVESLGSPYLAIAADVNNDNVLNFQDSLDMRNVILSINPTFPDSLAWRFVPADYVFPDPNNPFMPQFPEYINTGLLGSNLSNQDFVGIRVGDLNGSMQYNPNDITHVCLNLPSAISGHIYFDQNQDCLPDATEPTLGAWTVKVSGTGGTYYRNATTNGYYRVPIPPGVFDVTLIPPNGYWGGCASTYSNISVDEFEDVQQDFTTQAIIDCPMLEVDLSTNFLRRCFESYYYVNYCNLGTVTAENATVEVTFDSFLEFLNSSVPATYLSGNTYSFDIGDVPAGQCGDFNITVKVSCDAAIGQSHCSTAHIFPDSICYIGAQSDWDGADLAITGDCNSGEAKFTITNHGEDMMAPVGYVVIEDIMIQMISDNSLQLAHNASQDIVLPANGSTWRIEVEQTPDHPFQDLISAALEGCGTNDDGEFSIGYVEIFSQNDESPFEDEDCRSNIGSFDPNDKTGFPLGVQAAHYIPLEQTIDYLIRFQNTGTDTAFTVVIVDTLSSKLDPSTIRPLGSSHPYEFNLLGEGIIQFSFQNILLPDSTTNEPGSHGFVKFNIAPIAGLQNGEVIENEASIYFDFNEAVVTNKTLHTYGEQFLGIGNLHTLPWVELDVFPNPTSKVANFQLNVPDLTDGTIQFYNANGKLIMEHNVQAPQFQVDLTNLQAGPYWFRIISENLLLGSGQIQVITN